MHSETPVISRICAAVLLISRKQRNSTLAGVGHSPVSLAFLVNVLSTVGIACFVRDQSDELHGFQGAEHY